VIVVVIKIIYHGLHKKQAKDFKKIQNLKKFQGYVHRFRRFAPDRSNPSKININSGTGSSATPPAADDFGR
jgi:hypothetical protein